MNVRYVVCVCCLGFSVYSGSSDSASPPAVIEPSEATLLNAYYAEVNLAVGGKWQPLFKIKEKQIVLKSLRKDGKDFTLTITDIEITPVPGSKMNPFRGKITVRPNHTRRPSLTRTA